MLSSKNFIKFDGKFSLPICELDPDTINLQHLNDKKFYLVDAARLVLQIQKDNVDYVGFPFKAFVESVGNQIMKNPRLKYADLEHIDVVEKGVLNFFALFNAVALGEGFRYLLENGYLKKELVDGEDYYFLTHSLFGDNIAKA